MVKKPSRLPEFLEVVYSAERWALLERLRAKALSLMETLAKFNIETITHGSVARGDVTEKSDVDIFIPHPPSSFLIETALEQARISINRRLIVQATPAYAMKGYIEIDERTSVTFPLMNMRKIEREFYKFGGEAAPKTLKTGKRVAGVDKRLMLIEPTEKGHRESGVVGQEEHVAKILRISVETVLDRVHALLRRNEVGRTGVFLERELTEGETFELALKKLAEEKPAVRRRLKTV
ncbi:MAG: nucleotidyltransferase domain-containing protein [Candidatus Bathyarchaeia archaeon]